MADEPVAVIGIGQTKHAAARRDVSLAGLVREAAGRALADARLDWPDVDAVVIGKAPDFFEGVMMPELYLAEALGAVGKPMMRVHTAGSVGGSTALVAADLVAARVHRTVLTVAFEKQSESNAMWGLSLPIPFQQPLLAGAGGFFAPHVRAYLRRSGAPEDVGALVAYKDRRNALKNPYAHLHEDDLTLERVLASPMLWDPIRYSETCPSSDGACAMVLTDAVGARRAPHPPAWVHGRAMRSEPTMFAGKDYVSPRAGRDCAAEVYRQAGITDPRREIDVAELYVPFSWYEPMWLENLGFAAEGEGWRLTESRATALDGDLPVNPSGGVLSTNPIGASGMLRFAEAALQVRGLAGEHQVDGARRALGHAYGGGSQFFAMWLVGSERPDS
ncbi:MULTISPECIES: thiolase domain-containing protein [Streptomycetaceae]|uniref:Acetyl-CoA acetyltransferase n=1 Tax=Streptantibioticus cattleyicolor (strain ATCC 35852 / DSM 46488 / JCM 4925 / NBRC 14057 / NRRL 8057) TaxID=1003195 RepID=F8JV43_STREN|nr:MULTISPECIES: thiolase domain-containing protein [Streptomycetaceae]AEW93124.1 acetyl-CoA acetyltransferase [Streptantibioticus cattleyicolor NRRL 8057 = DSM 46488]MYS57852.1 thiolase domain-containing protein [Streptomyces sp. SID5468]CCB73483.1 Acetyl-CoA acetyltransferase [Streptantibioticus cattleyicolor NRRL 8057 = DSM 46488]